MSTTSHRFAFASSAPAHANDFGSQWILNQSNFPILDKLALYRVILRPGAFREPHWHPNTDELSYCLRGKLLVTIFGNHAERHEFVVEKGEMFFVPSGYLHGFENLGEGEAEVIICFAHENPEDFGLSGSVGFQSKSVMGNTWSLPEEELGAITSSVEDILIGKTDGPAMPPVGGGDSPYRFRVEAQDPPGIASEYGCGKTAQGVTWPVLRDQSMISLHLHGDAMREPHWHPQTAEMGYVAEGEARMTVRGPGDAVETYHLKPGDVYFIPRAYPHHIEDLGTGPLHFLIFFDQATGGDIGYTGGISAFPARIIAPTVGTTVAGMPKIPHYDEDLKMVAKTNPVAPY